MSTKYLKFLDISKDRIGTFLLKKYVSISLWAYTIILFGEVSLFLSFCPSLS